MKIELKKFQEDTVALVLDEIRAAQAECSRKPQAVSLTAPTGAGKTIIVTAVMERLLEGDEAQSPDPNATLLWLSDQPEVNEQSMRKILAASNIFSPSTVRVIDAAFDQRVFTAGIVYFLNSQKIGKDKSLVGYGDPRQYTIWDTVRNTITDRPGSFVLIIDEAHRGMLYDSENEEAQSIAQKFLKGDKDIPPVPVILGISATPERFNKLAASGKNRTLRPVDVDPEDVRLSGLLKEDIKVLHPKEKQHSDWTLLRKAAQMLMRFEQEWRSYTEAESIDPVAPLLVVQVEDGTAGLLSRTDLKEVLSVLQQELGNPPLESFAHAFQEGASVEIDGNALRYIAPSDIQGDTALRVVLFKSSLSTGWDCPRAEVMMSFRPASDGTLIAQLVGRMVRTPLARIVPSNDFLNSVALFLPYYDRASVDSVVRYLTSESGDASPRITVSAEEPITVMRDPSKADCFLSAVKLTGYTIPSVRRANEVNRLMRLSRRLVEADIEPEAVDKSRASLMAVIRRVLKSAVERSDFQEAIQKGGKLTLLVRTHRPDGRVIEEEQSVTTDSEDLMLFFEDASRKLREGLAASYVKGRVDKGAELDEARIELIALVQKTDLVSEVNEKAEELTASLLKKFSQEISQTDDDTRAGFDEIRRLSTGPQPVALTLPLRFEASEDDDKYEGHLFISDNGTFPCDLNNWESAVIKAETQSPSFLGWFRNPDRKKWSLTVPYQMSGRTKPLYPDFLSFRRRTDGSVGISLLDPHLSSLDDAAPKAVGLAAYAAKHGHDFDRIEIIQVEKGKIQRLDLKDDSVREKVAGVTTNEHLRQLFALLAPRRTSSGEE